MLGEPHVAIDGKQSTGDIAWFGEGGGDCGDDLQQDPVGGVAKKEIDIIVFVAKDTKGRFIHREKLPPEGVQPRFDGSHLHGESQFLRGQIEANVEPRMMSWHHLTRFIFAFERSNNQPSVSSSGISLTLGSLRRSGRAIFHAR